MIRREEIYRFGDIRVEPRTARVFCGERPLAVEPKAFDVLCFLIENRGRLIEKQELLDAVWEGSVVTENAMTRVVAQLRKLLGDQAREARYIETVPTKGYRFIADVATEKDVRADAPAESAGDRRPSWTVGLLSALLAIALLSAASYILTSTPPDRVGARHVALPLNGPLIQGAWAQAFDLSPDGRRLVFVGREPGAPRGQLFVRDMRADTLFALPGTEGAAAPSFSPDNEWVSFLIEGRLAKMQVEGSGRPETIFDNQAPWSARIRSFWLSEREIALARLGPQQLEIEVFENGQPSRQLARVAITPGDYLSWVDVSPDRRGLLLSVKSDQSPGEPSIEFLQLETSTRKKLVTGHHGHFLPMGHLAYVANDALIVTPMDFERAEISGPQTVVVNGLLSDAHLGIAQLAHSEDGTLAYLSPIATRDLSLVSSDRSGNATVIDAKAFQYSTPVFSPSGAHVAFRDMSSQNARSLWLFELASGTTRRVPLEGNPVAFVFLPSGGGVFYADSQEGVYNVFKMPLTGARRPERVTTSDNRQFPKSISADGRTLVYEEENGIGRQRDIWLLDLDEKGAPSNPRALIATGADEREASLSPDGRFIVYQSNQSGRNEIYIASIRSDVSWQASTDGGRQPIFTHGGSEVIFRNGPLMMSVSVTEDDPPEIGFPSLLFETDFIDPGHRNFDVSADGSRVIGVRVNGLTPYDTVQLLIDWPAKLDSREPKTHTRSRLGARSSALRVRRSDRDGASFP